MNAIRDWVNNNSAVATVLLVLVLVGCLGLIVNQRSGGTPPELQAWYYDTVTKEFFPSSLKQIPPFARENGNEAVRAYLFTCSDCTEANRFAGRFEKYTAQRKTELAELGEKAFVSGDLGETGLLVSSDGVNWVPGESSEADRIRKAPREKCSAPVKTCAPQ